jgi:HKD family nuclease
MASHTSQFLKNPAEIRARVKELQGGRRLDLAVAFIGADWWELLANHTGRLRVICWLSSTNTNPDAVEDLMERPQTEVRQRDSMHCKVYLSPGIGAIVGSANLSKSALNDEQIAGQDEAAVFLSEAEILCRIEEWFDAMWKDSETRPIQESDLNVAKDARKRAKQERQGTQFHFKRRKADHVPQVPSQFHPTVLSYAKTVRRMENLEADIGEPCTFVKSIEPESLTKEQQHRLVDQIVTWTRHPGSYKNFLAQPIANVRKGLALLFDDGKDPYERLDQIWSAGYLEGLLMPTISLLLYWRNPERFPPYNFRTATFLKDFNLNQQGLSASSPLCYERWRRWATRLAQQLKLPTPGHIDRMVERYHEDTYA